MAFPRLVDLTQIALFLDFDGTLVAISDRPDTVRLEPETRIALEALHRRLDGAVAIVTGRDIAVIDNMLAPLCLPVAGVHGATRRDAKGVAYAVVGDGRLIAAVEDRVRPLLTAHPGLLLERKNGAVALHYRAHPELERNCIELMQTVVDSTDDAVLKHGKMVVEATVAAGDKGKAIAAFMTEPPFAGRRPVFAGDDITDEDAFTVVNDMGGITIKIGDGATAASWRASTSKDFVRWLRDLSVDQAGKG